MEDESVFCFQNGPGESTVSRAGVRALTESASLWRNFRNTKNSEQAPSFQNQLLQFNGSGMVGVNFLRAFVMLPEVSCYFEPARAHSTQLNPTGRVAIYEEANITKGCGAFQIDYHLLVCNGVHTHMPVVDGNHLVSANCGTLHNCHA